MHRSGTSAAAGLLARLGLGTPPAEDLIPATRSNEEGHWESKRFVAFNERLLSTLGGAWTSPPDLIQGWESEAALETLRREGAEVFASVFASRPMALKDPRLCIVLPFWRKVIEPPVAAVLVYRDPVEVAMSLEARDGLRPLHALALWERYLRSASAGLDGVPTLAADYRSLLRDPGAWCHEVSAFLADVGIEADPLEDEDSERALDSKRHRQRAPEVIVGGVAESAQQLMSTLRELEGRHDPWCAPELGPEPSWVEDVLAMRSELDALRRAHRQFEVSRAHRLVSWAHRHRHPRP